MAGWYHQLNGHGFGWTPGVGDGQGGLACCGAKSWTWLSDFTSLQVPHITGAIRYLPFCIWLILPSIMTTKYIHDIRNASEFPSILRLNNIPSMDRMEVKPVDPKGNQSWVFIGRTDAEAETPILWTPDVKNWLLGKDTDAGKDWRQKKKGTTEDNMVGWHHRVDGHEFEQAPGVGDGQGSLACYSPWGLKELDTTEQLNWTELNIPSYILLIHSSIDVIDGHLGCFHLWLLWIMLLWTWVHNYLFESLFSTVLGIITVGCCCCCCCLETIILFSTLAVAFYISTSMYKISVFTHPCQHLLFCALFLY